MVPTSSSSSSHCNNSQSKSNHERLESHNNHTRIKKKKKKEEANRRMNGTKAPSAEPTNLEHPISTIQSNTEETAFVQRDSLIKGKKLKKNGVPVIYSPSSSPATASIDTRMMSRPVKKKRLKKNGTQLYPTKSTGTSLLAAAMEAANGNSDRTERKIEEGDKEGSMVMKKKKTKKRSFDQISLSSQNEHHSPFDLSHGTNGNPENATATSMSAPNGCYKTNEERPTSSKDMCSRANGNNDEELDASTASLGLDNKNSNNSDGFSCSKLSSTQPQSVSADHYQNIISSDDHHHQSAATTTKKLNKKKNPHAANNESSNGVASVASPPTTMGTKLEGGKISPSPKRVQHQQGQLRGPQAAPFASLQSRQTTITAESLRPSSSVSSAPILSVATSMLATTGNVPINAGRNDAKKRKRISPFRVKTGCFVAVRYGSNGNDFLSDNKNEISPCPSGVLETWIDPVVGRHEGYALLGRRIRCCFPKSALTAATSSTSERVIEGEIVELVEYPDAMHKLWNDRAQRRSHRFIPTRLLVDAKDLRKLTFLQEQQQAAVREAEQASSSSSCSERERQRIQHETQIRGGADKVMVRINLADPMKLGQARESEHRDSAADISTGANSNGKSINDAAEEMKIKSPLICKWVLRQRTLRHNTTTTTSKHYVGNKHDGESQQESNWRWLAARRSSTPPSEEFMGQVEGMQTNTNGSSNNNKSLATVTVRKLVVPEMTKWGRTISHGATDVFLPKGKQETVQIPIEHLVVAARKLSEEEQQETQDGRTMKQHPTLSWTYSYETNSYEKIAPDTSRTTDNSSTLICHRCGRRFPELFKDQLSTTPDAISCTGCIYPCKGFGKSGTFLKSCRCRECSVHHAQKLNSSFRKAARMAEAKLTKDDDVSEDDEDRMKATNGAMLSMECSFCCLRCKSGVSCGKCRLSLHKRCAKFTRTVASEEPTLRNNSNGVCRTCGDDDDDDDASNEEIEKEETLLFGPARRLVQTMRFTDFDLPDSFSTLLESTVSSAKPITALKPRGATPRKNKSGRPPARKQSRSPHREANVVSSSEALESKGSEDQESNEDSIFRPSCSRLLPYDPIKRRFMGVSKHHLQNDPSSEKYKDLPRIVWRTPTVDERRTKTRGSRAARANQRRVRKDVSGFLEIDSLAGRESSLRFDRSGIHAWGVFADKDIQKGEMVVEYRGELIGNAMAEKREKEYEEAKIGSDYMFRIDGTTVCDATKQGNVARFINASCDPNCYTQIITLNNVKRIVIYAKKEIKAGQELCYDYKFPTEFDPEKRIPCHCGTKDCRGFMNWDKKYVAVPFQKSIAGNAAAMNTAGGGKESAMLAATNLASTAPSTRVSRRGTGSSKRSIAVKNS